MTKALNWICMATCGFCALVNLFTGNYSAFTGWACAAMWVYVAEANRCDVVRLIEMCQIKDSQAASAVSRV